MTNEDKKLVFEYCEWKIPCNGHEANAEACINEGDTCIKCEFYHPLDGNDMVAAMNKMQLRCNNDETHWQQFILHLTEDIWAGDLLSLYEWANFYHWLMQPARFFELMAKWLEKQK